MSDRPRRWHLAIPLVLVLSSAFVQGCICYPRTYGHGYGHDQDHDYGHDHGRRHDHYYTETAAEIREPEYRAPEPPPPPPRRRRPPEG